MRLRTVTSRHPEAGRRSCLEPQRLTVGRFPTKFIDNSSRPAEGLALRRRGNRVSSVEEISGANSCEFPETDSREMSNGVASALRWVLQELVPPTLENTMLIEPNRVQPSEPFKADAYCTTGSSCRTSTSGGSAACSPTSRPSRSGSGR